MPSLNIVFHLISIFNDTFTWVGTTASTAAINSLLAEAVGTVGRELGGDQPDLAVVASAGTALEATHDLLGENLVGEGGDQSGDNQETVHSGTDEFCVNTRILKIVWFQLHKQDIYLCVCVVWEPQVECGDGDSNKIFIAKVTYPVIHRRWTTVDPGVATLHNTAYKREQVYTYPWFFSPKNKM